MIMNDQERDITAGWIKRFEEALSALEAKQLGRSSPPTLIEQAFMDSTKGQIKVMEEEITQYDESRRDN